MRITVNILVFSTCSFCFINFLNPCNYMAYKKNVYRLTVKITFYFSSYKYRLQKKKKEIEI